MRRHKTLLIGLLALLASNVALTQAELLIPRSTPGDDAQYYLLEMGIEGDIVSASHKRVSSISVGYTKTETNCKTMKMREIGFSETSLIAIKTMPTKWFDLVDGSTKSDLASFVCAIKAIQVINDGV